MKRWLSMLDNSTLHHFLDLFFDLLFLIGIIPVGSQTHRDWSWGQAGGNVLGITNNPSYFSNNLCNDSTSFWSSKEAVVDTMNKWVIMPCPFLSIFPVEELIKLSLPLLAMPFRANLDPFIPTVTQFFSWSSYTVLNTIIQSFPNAISHPPNLIIPKSTWKDFPCTDHINPWQWEVQYM